MFLNKWIVIPAVCLLLMLTGCSKQDKEEAVMNSEYDFSEFADVEITGIDIESLSQEET